MSGASQSSIDYLKCLYVKNLDIPMILIFGISFFSEQNRHLSHNTSPLPNNNAGMPYYDF